MNTKILIPVTLIAGIIIGSAIIPKLQDDNGDAIAQNTSSTLDEKTIIALIEKYISENPQAIIDSVTALQHKQQADTLAKAQENIQKYKDQLQNDADTPFIGNPNADLAVVEFFDYSCGYCRKALPDILKVVENHKNVKVVFKEYPILGPSSKITSEAATAVHLIAPDKYFDFHKALMMKRVNTLPGLQAIAKELGIDSAKMAETMKSEKVKNILAKNRELAQNIGVRGTPAFVIGEQFIPGAVNYESIKTILDQSS